MNHMEVHTLRVSRASPAWKLIMQSGVGIKCTVGIFLDVMLCREFGLSEEQISLADSIILDGMPVDEPEKAVVPGYSRLALAAGLPGIAGLSMKKGSAVRGLRSGITHTQTITEAPLPGEVTLSLYSLTLPRLSGHFLARGIWASPEQIVRYSQFTQESSLLLDGEPIQSEDLADTLNSFPANSRVNFTATIMS